MKSDQPTVRKVVRIECPCKSAKQTKVFLDDGSELQGITRIDLVALPNDVWRAQIHVLPDSIALHAEAEVTQGELPAPVDGAQEVTAFGDTARAWKAADDASPEPVSAAEAASPPC